ncbi:hypothetical protein SAMN03159496_02012 [Rhizobium sp. NFR07]|uniref:RNase A-like domain-containing protein n=1 Tax=Rhizobium sp. NFR07 TaxID=1566262 RepID=UPI0008F2470E|nr:RNase A-like domain-containing protein [Rhizobium sp. NFR07]SFB15398.1 hypothetical protein SAMN03159496_02012 [Rhizobium sp. NFR07]
MIAAALAGGNDGLRVVLSPSQLVAALGGDTAGGEPAARSVHHSPDAMVPIAGALFAGAVRVASVTGGRIELMKHEVMSGIKLGVCPIGLSDGALRHADGPAGSAHAGRLTATFENLLIAERSLSLALRIRSAIVGNWLRTAPRGRSLDFGMDTGRVIGKGLVPESDAVHPMTRIHVRLTRETYNGQPYVIAISRPAA